MRVPWRDDQDVESGKICQASRHARVLGFGRLDHEPRERRSAPGESLQEPADGLRLPAAGGSADERMAVQRSQADGERPGRAEEAVQDHSELDVAARLAVGFEGGVERRGCHHPEAGKLRLGRSHQSSGQVGRGPEGYLAPGRVAVAVPSSDSIIRAGQRAVGARAELVEGDGALRCRAEDRGDREAHSLLHGAGRDRDVPDAAGSGARQLPEPCLAPFQVQGVGFGEAPRLVKAEQAPAKRLELAAHVCLRHWRADDQPRIGLMREVSGDVIEGGGRPPLLGLGGLLFGVAQQRFESASASCPPGEWRE